MREEYKTKTDIRENYIHRIHQDVQHFCNLIVTYVSSFTQRFLQIAQLSIVVVCVKPLRKHIIQMYQHLTYITVKFGFN